MRLDTIGGGHYVARDFRGLKSFFSLEGARRDGG